MKFLKEVNESVEYIVEAKADSNDKDYYITGVFMQGDEKNRNGRVYPTDILIKEMNRYTNEMIKTKRSIGELNHPDTIQVNPERASHIITELWQDGNTIKGKAKILNTPMGKLVKSLMDEGIQLGVSSRGVGTIKESKGTKVVGDDFHLATVDIVSDPSAQTAFVENIMESKEYYIDNGIIKEKSINEFVEAVKSPKRLDEAKLLKAFSKLLADINN